MGAGTVYLVGAGPGDPGLITVRGMELLRRADVVVYDHLVAPELLEEAPHAEKINVGKRAGVHTMEQEEICKLLASYAFAGKRVVRLKGGDPFVFGRGGEEADYLAERGIAFEIVPGVTAGIGGPAYAGIPVTDRRFASTVYFSTGHRAEEAAPKESGAPNSTCVFYMAARRLREVAANLMKEGVSPDTSAAVIRWATTPMQQTVVGALRDIAERAAGIEPPAILVVGDVVRLRERLAWLEKRPLFGRTIAVTRPREQSRDLAEKLLELGARVIISPCIRIEPLDEFSGVDRILAELRSFDWVVFTSANGVEHVFRRLRALGKDARAFGDAKVCCIGPATAQAAERWGIAADLLPPEYRTDLLAAALAGHGGLEGRRVLLARTNVASTQLRKALEDAGANCTEIVVYRTAMERHISAELEEALDADAVDLVIFTSSSAVRAFVSAAGRERAMRLSEKGAIASIGPVTSRTLRDMGLRPACEATEHSATGIVKAILDWAAEKQKRKSVKEREGKAPT